MSWESELVRALLAFIEQYGYLGVFVFMFLETSLLFPFLPSEVVVPVAAALLVGATVIGVVATHRGAWQWVVLGVVVLVAAVCTRAPGRAPFYATMLIAGIDLAIIVIR